VLLFGIEGNTRALKSGTARLQSRFFVMSLAIENRYSPNGARPAKPSEQEKHLNLLIK